MGAARVLEWTLPSPVTTSPRPSWLVAALPNASTDAVSAIKSSPPRARLSIVPGGRAESAAPAPLSVKLVDVAVAAAVARDAERAERDATIITLGLEIEALRGKTAELAATLARARRSILEASEGELVKLALAIAERVVGATVAAEPAAVASWAKEAVAAMPARDAMVVAISPDLAELVPESAWAAATNDTHRLEVDPALAPATCEVRSGATTIEVSGAARLAAVGEAIGVIS